LKQGTITEIKSLTSHTPPPGGFFYIITYSARA
jgi:hypothetical protein